MEKKKGFLRWALSSWHFWALLLCWVTFDLFLGALTIGGLIVGSAEKFVFVLLIYLIGYWVIKPTQSIKPKNL